MSNCPNKVAKSNQHRYSLPIDSNHQGVDDPERTFGTQCYLIMLWVITKQLGWMRILARSCIGCPGFNVAMGEPHKGLNAFT
eukprot:6464624-Amphidinium_carterae.1